MLFKAKTTVQLVSASSATREHSLLVNWLIFHPANAGIPNSNNNKPAARSISDLLEGFDKPHAEVVIGRDVIGPTRIRRQFGI